MDIINITVITALNKQYFEPEITKHDFPPGIDGKLRKSSASIDKAGGAAVLLITDRPDLVRAFVNRGLDNSYAVYIGDPSDIGSIFGQVTDIWSPFDDRALLKKRYRLLLGYIKCRCTLRELEGRGAL